jgi:hypothetical protein
MRNAYVPNAGELMVGNQLEEHGWAVYLPAKDVGIDLLAERAGRFVRVQVKESRTYDNANPEMHWHSWSQLRPDALRKAAGVGVDVFVFVVHAPDERGHRRRIVPFYVVIGPLELEARLAAYRRTPDRAVAWHRDGDGKLWEVRTMATRSAGARYKVPERDFTRYLDNWDAPISGERRAQRAPS